MLSRVLGLVRDIVIARYFGASATVGADAFFVAFKIPNFLRRLFAEGAFAQAFVPVLSEYQTKSSRDEVKSLVDHVAGTLGVCLLLLTVIGVFAAPLLALIFAPGFSQYEDKLALTADMLRLTFPYLFFISLTAFAGSILNSNNRFGVPAFTPVLLNLALIGATFYLTPYLQEPVMALAWGVLIAGIAQLFFQLPFLKRIDLLPRPKWGWRHSGVRKIMKLMVPALFGVSVSQINLLLDTLLASFLQTGSVAWLYFSDRLVELPLGVFGIAIATVILPSLSRKHASEDTKVSQQGYQQTMDWGLRSVFVIGMPAALALCVLAEPMLTTLFQYGEMTGHDVEMAGRSSEGLFTGADGLYADQSAGAGLLFPPGHQDPGQNRDLGDGDQYGAEPVADLVAATRRPGVSHLVGGFRQCRVIVYGSLSRRDLPSAGWLDSVFAAPGGG